MAPVIIFHGPPNAGKSSQAKILAKSRRCRYISSGDLLRNSKDPAIRARLASGQLAKSEDFNQALYKALETIPEDQGIVLDGVARMLPEFKRLSEWLGVHKRQIEAVVEISITEDESHARSRERARHDDHATDERWRWYKAETMQVINHCRDQGFLKSIDGHGTPEEVAERVEAALA